MNLLAQSIMDLFKSTPTTSQGVLPVTEVLPSLLKEHDARFIRNVMIDRWNHDKFDADFNVAQVMGERFSSFKTDKEGNITGESMFSVSKGFANVLLYKLKHELPVTTKDHKSISRFAAVLAKEGIKNSVPKDPIIIDTHSMEIIQGVKRLYALAISAAEGTFFEVELV